MKILALETSHTPGQVALLDRDQVVWQQALPTGRRTTESFASVMQEGLQVQGWKPQEVEWFAISRGPGSFTGLRIGVTAAKLFGYLTGCRVVSVDTMWLLALQVPADTHSFWVVLDAQRQQLCVRRFERTGDGLLVAASDEMIVDGQSWLCQTRDTWTVTGSGLQRWVERLAAGTTVVPREAWVPQAASLGRLALQQIERGEIDDIWSLVPRYHRPSAAEEKAASSSA